MDDSEKIEKILLDKILKQRRDAITYYMENYDKAFSRQVSPTFVDPLALVEINNQNRAPQEAPPSSLENHNQDRTANTSECIEDWIHKTDGYIQSKSIINYLQSNDHQLPQETPEDWNQFQGNWMSFKNYIKNWHVGNQGLTNSCNGWVAADSIITFIYYKLKAEENSERITLLGDKRFEVNREKLPSVRFIWKATKKNTELETEEILSDNIGTTLDETLETLNGMSVLPTRNKIPFLTNAPFPMFRTNDELLSGCERDDNCFTSEYGDIETHVVFDNNTKFRTLSASDQNKIILLTKKWLNYIGPLALEIKIPPEFKNLSMSTNPHNPIPIVPIDNPSREYRRHTVAIVGIEKLQSKTFLIIRNQHGIDWGYFGQALLPIEYLFMESSRPVIGTIIFKNQSNPQL